MWVHVGVRKLKMQARTVAPGHCFALTGDVVAASV